MPESTLFEWLNAGGNLGIFALVYIMWKFDRRLLIVEKALEALAAAEKKKAGGR